MASFGYNFQKPIKEALSLKNNTKQPGQVI